MKQLALICALLLTGCADEAAESRLRGYPVNLRFASTAILLKDTAASAEQIEAYMHQTVPNWAMRPQTAAALTEVILQVAEDFAMDARLLTAMIAHESAFDARAVSVTGAVGLTQLTVPGVEEFLDQTGILYVSLGNKPYAGTGIAYFQAAIQKNWPDFPIGRVLPDLAARTAWARQSKAETFSNPGQYRAQIIAGATILKAAITYCCSKQGACSVDTVREGLERYNGDTKLRPDGEPVKVYYAKDILKRVEQI